MNTNFSNKTLNSEGKRLSFLLRHDKDYAFIGKGYRSVDELITKQGFSFELLNTIVETNDKQRYEFNDDKTLIRARQGHSVDVDVELKEVKPPFILYHGTAIRFLESILKEGIKKMNRNYVQLSNDLDTAESVGSRHGKSIILLIDTKKMEEDNIKFYLSANNVVLTDYVHPKYIKGYASYSVLNKR